MILSILLALLQPAAASAPTATEATYYVHGGDPFAALLDSWDREGVIWRADPGSPVDFRACMGAGLRPIDAECVRRLLPASPDGPPPVALVAHETGRRHVLWNLACVGPDGVGMTRLSPGDPFVSNLGLRNAARSQIADCISTALKGAALFRAEAQTQPSAVSGTHKR